MPEPIANSLPLVGRDDAAPKGAHQGGFGPRPGPQKQARAFRRTLTPAEATLWRELKTWRARGWHWRRQAPFRGWFLDFVCFTHRVVVEVDGIHHVVDPEQRKHDALRDQVLAREGFTTLRVTNHSVRHDFAAVLAEIDLLARQPTPMRALRRCIVPPDEREGAD